MTKSSFLSSSPPDHLPSTMASSSPPEKPPSRRHTSHHKPSAPLLAHQDSDDEPYKELKWKELPLCITNQDTSELGAGQSLEDTFPKQTLPIHAGRTALLVVDVQPEYWSQCPAVRADFPEFPDNLAHLVQTCRAQKAKVIWVRADYRYAHSPWLVQFARLHQGRIPSEVYSDPSQVHKSSSWESFATPQGGEYVLPKTSWSSTRHTALMDLLKQSGIDTVLVCGLITSVCVQHSAFGIFEAGYRTILVTDACADRGRARHDAALALYGDYMYELVTTTQLSDDTSPLHLRPAEPVWLTLPSQRDDEDSNPQQFLLSSLQDSVVTGSTASSTIADEDYSLATTKTTNNNNNNSDHGRHGGGSKCHSHGSHHRPIKVPTTEQSHHSFPPQHQHYSYYVEKAGEQAHQLPPKPSSSSSSSKAFGHHGSLETARTSSSSLSTLSTTPPEDERRV